MSIRKIYASELRHHLSLFAVWPPGDPIEAGDVGLLSEGVFEKQTTVSDLFRDLELRFVETGIDAPYTFHSQGKDTVQVRVSGDVPVGGSPGLVSATASAEIRFGKKGGVVMDARDLTRRSIDNLFEVSSYIQQNRRSWPNGFVLVASSDRTGSCQVLVSEATEADFQLSGKAEAIRDLKIADASISVMHGIVAGYICSPRGPIAIIAHG